MEIFEGCWTALATPFRGGAVDYEALGVLVDRQAAAGVAGLVACGCTGEAATLSRDETLQVIRFVLSRSRGLPVMGGSGRNDTAETVSLSRDVAALGVHSLLVITPYYNKPSQRGLIAHYEAVADAVDVPVVAYNVPGRTCVSLQPETLAAMSRHPRIAAVKDAAGSVERVTSIRELCGIAILSGDDHLALAQMAMGASGVVSVISNVVPEAVAEMTTLALEGSFGKARLIHERIAPLAAALFLESNPVPLKRALHVMGLIAEELRPPLVPMREDLRPGLEKALAAVLGA